MIKLIIDSSYCFSEELAKKYDVSVLETCVTINDTLYYSNPFWKTVNKDYMLDYMRDGGLPKISQAPLQSWIKTLEELVKSEDTYVYISPQRKFGGGLRSFSIIRNLNENFKDRLFVFEGTGSGSSTEMEVLEILSRLTDNTTVEEISRWVEELNNKVKCYVISESLLHWVNSGRSDADINFPNEVPIMKLSDKGDTFSPLFLGQTFEESLDYFLKEISTKNFSKCAISYTYGIPEEWKLKYREVIESTGCKVITEHLFSPNVTSVVGVNSLSAAFI